VPVDTVPPLLVQAGVPADQAQAIADDYAVAQMDGLKSALGAVAFLSILSLWFTRQLPGRPTAEPDPERAREPEPVAAT
jgi:hypothetical protein